MGVIIVTQQTMDTNIPPANTEILNKLSTDISGNLLFNGKIIQDNSIEVAFNIILTQQHITQKYIELPENCDTSRVITVNIQGLNVIQNFDWEMIEKSNPEKDLISWAELGLESLVRIGDRVFITYYKKV